MKLDAKLLEVLACPLTKQPLHYDETRNVLISKQAGLEFEIRNGIPIMLLDEARKINN
ncbi:MAG TPA: hypothetical protein DIV86_04480 [Alphaproteobacteria bacterium]|nr:hypothetical protein [Alphaproteobacteria bacterium]